MVWGRRESRNRKRGGCRGGGSRGIEFISSSSLRRNIEATQELQAELLQKCTPAVQLVASMITAAADKQASDIHIEPQATDAVVRLRVDGILRDYQRIPQSIQTSVVSRIKILATWILPSATRRNTGVSW